MRSPNELAEGTMRTIAAIFLGLLWLSGAQAYEEARAERERDARASLFRAEAHLSRSLGWGGPEGFARSVAPDVAYLHPAAEIIVGRGNMLEFLKTAYAPYLPGMRAELHRVAGDVSADGSLGYTFGWLDETRTRRDDGVVETVYGRYVAVWKRQGDWQVQVFLRLAGSAPLAPAPADALIVDGEPGVKQRDTAEAHALTASVADARFADLSLAQGYSIAFDRYAADAAILVTAGDIFWNRAGVNVAFAGWSPDQSLRWHPLRAGAAGSGDLAWTIGHGDFITGIGGTEKHGPSKYLTVWLRTPAGWRFLIDGGNARPPDP
jgi:ketosteroid isomerase-like protein